MAVIVRLFVRYCLCATLALLLTACKVELHTQLSEVDSNEVVAAVQSAGLEAFKHRVDEKHWAVEVHDHDFASAVEILRAAGLPRDKYASIGQIFKREGLVSSPSEERIRFIYGVEQELARTLSEIDGVIVARVHIVLPMQDSLSDKTRPSSASVFIKHKPNIDFKNYVTTAKNIVVRGVEGLSPDAVVVTALPSALNENKIMQNPPAKFWGITVTSVDTSVLWFLLFLFLMPLAVCVILILRYRHLILEDWDVLKSRLSRSAVE